MSATKLVLHHRYRDDIAYDWSRNNNHGHLVGVHTGTGAAPNVLLYGGGPARVEVRPSPSLRDFGELRVRAVFRADAELPVRRFNLVEGEFAFALVRDADGSLHGTINTPGAGWLGPQSAPGLVKTKTWHTADFVHDGISHGRLFLDDQLVAERWDVFGPIRDLGARGVWIGHWPGDDRYTLHGQLAEVAIWKDDPHRDAARAIDDCCLDKAWLDERIAEARRRGWTGEKARDRCADFFALCRAAVAEVRGGDASRTKTMATLTQQGMNALAGRDAAGLTAVITSLQPLVLAQLGGTRIDQLGHELWDALRATPLGEWLHGSEAESLAFLGELVRRSCLDDVVPKPPHRGEDHPPHEPDRRPSGDPDTDHDPPPDPVPSDEKPEEPPTDIDEGVP